MTFAWELSLGIFRLESSAWDRSLGNVRLGTLACELSLDFASVNFRLGMFPCQLSLVRFSSFGNCCLEMLAWGFPPGKFGFVILD